MQLLMLAEKIQNQLDKKCISIRPLCYPGCSMFLRVLCFAEFSFLENLVQVYKSYRTKFSFVKGAPIVVNEYWGAITFDFNSTIKI